LIFIGFVSCFLIKGSVLKAQPSPEAILAASAIFLIDSVPGPIQYFSWENQDTLARHQEFYLAFSEMKYEKATADSLTRSLSVVWMYRDSTLSAPLAFPWHYSDRISRKQYRVLHPRYFKSQLQADSPFFFPAYVLPTAGILAGILLISGMFYFRTRS
jgi:hypothetical protein